MIYADLSPDLFDSTMANGQPQLADWGVQKWLNMCGLRVLPTEDSRHTLLQKCVPTVLSRERRMSWIMLGCSLLITDHATQLPPGLFTWAASALILRSQRLVQQIWRTS